MPPSEDLVIALYRLGLVQRSIARHALGRTRLAGLHGARRRPARGARAGERRGGPLSVDLSVASRQVAALVLAGYVRRDRDPEDGRAHILRPTEAGTRVLTDSHRRMVATATERWPAGRTRRSPGSPPSSSACARTSPRLIRTEERMPHDRS